MGRVSVGLFGGGVGVDFDPASIDRQMIILPGKVRSVSLLIFHHRSPGCAELLDKSLIGLARSRIRPSTSGKRNQAE